MGCFIAPATGALVSKIATNAVKSNEEKKNVHECSSHKIPFSRKLGWLTKMSAGGSVLLAFEHMWHGEVTPWAPFLTAAANPEDAVAMVNEIATVGVTMMGAILVVWAGMLAVARSVEKKAEEAETVSE